MGASIKQLEQISLRAWQALETETYDGWILRYANGYTGRANSVQALGTTSLPVDEKIAHCEAWYQQRALPCIFRLTDAMHPPNLDAVLDQRGYHRYNETLVQTASLADVAFATDDRFHYQTTLSDDWLTAWATWNTVSASHQAIAKQMLSQQTLASCYAWVDEMAVGLAVVEDTYVGLFDIVVQPDARGQGLGRALMTSLLAWSQTQGAQLAYLQVTTINVPALSLYDTLGFTTHHRYWYRKQNRIPVWHL